VGLRFSRPMTGRLIIAALLAALALGIFAWATRGSSHNDVVARVVDGDTIELASGTRVRLVQIDTPEKRTECYGDEASGLTQRLLPAGTHVRIEQDPGLDQVDRYRRKLAYVFKGDEDVNLTLVEQGAAGVWFFDGRRGRYADALLEAAEQARAADKGLWGACPLARFDPLDSLSSGPAS
jgi:micrococcal nuclease